MRNILCVIDPTTSTQPALKRAAAFAEQIGGNLELLICDYNSFLNEERYFDADALLKARTDLLDAHKRTLFEYAEEYRTPGVEITVDVIWDHPLHEGIVRHAIVSEADIVFKDTHQHPGLGMTGLSNSDWNLIRLCPFPLWLVKPGEYPATPTIVAAIDPMHQNDKPAALDEEILRTSKMVAKAINGELHVFHAFDAIKLIGKTIDVLKLPTYTPPAIVEERARQQHDESFTKITKKHDIADECTHLISGAPHRALPKLATEVGASLVVMGAVSRNILKRLFIGSTAELTLDRLPCDLLVIKPAWFESQVGPGWLSTD